MNKKQIAYILIGVGVLAAAYYLFKKSAASKQAGSLGAGAPDTRGSWAAEDDALYNQMRDKFKAHNKHALGWIDPLVKQRYEGSDGITGERVRMIQGSRSKAGAFLSVFEEVNPNEKGTYTNSAGQKVLFPHDLHDYLWKAYNLFQVKYGGL